MKVSVEEKAESKYLGGMNGVEEENGCGSHAPFPISWRNTIGQDAAEAASREGVVKKNVSFRDEGYVSALSKYINAATTASSSSSSETAMKVIAAGKKYMGTPYKFGSDRSTTTTFDCSDFVRQAYKEEILW